ncbi:MAG: 2-hydroxyglutaryl-CoA dehydratase [Fimbriimonadaceae bacterium]|nr:2-hydroxyglutaryl-CoA dehydratase [Fimbriimonadaceae bacterium]
MGWYAGIDSGSLTCAAVLINDRGALCHSEVVLTGARSRLASERALLQVIGKAGLNAADLTAIVATGYGRERVDGRTSAVTEITCHARGAVALFPQTQLVLDVGGQDCKAIRLAPGGKVIDFAMNDKCAAGTGRFFEVMARALEIDLDDLGPLALEAQRAVGLSNMCTVFAESEVVSLVAREEPVANIAAGLCSAAAERVRSLAQRVGVAPEVTCTGGGALNSGLVRAIERLLGVTANVPAEPQLVGAYGAALLGLENHRGAA